MDHMGLVFIGEIGIERQGNGLLVIGLGGGEIAFLET
jgi:hypothetical protein